MTKKLKPIGWAAIEVSKWLDIGATARKIGEEMTLFEPLPETSPAALDSTRTHKTQTRTNDLAAIIKRAKRDAANPNDASSVWAEMVKLAELPSEERPAPMIGVENGEIRYLASNGEIKFFTRAALYKRMARAR